MNNMFLLHEDNDLRQSTLKLFVGLFVIVLTIKITLASILDLYSDEIFYWQASTHPALAYSDLPFITATLTGLGSSAAPGSTFAARSLFLLLGTSLPFLIYWLGKPITGSQRALEAALLSLCLPLGASLGMLAVPDVPIIFFGLLALGFFERAIRHGNLGYWVATGLVVALGLSTHYRFFLYPAAAVLFLLISSEHRGLWKTPGLWLAIFIAVLGLIPIISFNASNQLGSAAFYLIERHPWEFQSQGLLHIFKQALVVTPTLYAVFVVAVFYLYRLARSGDSRALLFLCLSLVNLLVYLILAPWTDDNSTSVHWPLSGYFVLLIYVPDCLRICHGWFKVKWNAKLAHKAILSVPVIGFLGTLIGFLGVGSQGFQNQLRPLLGTDTLSNKMAGWQEFTTYVDTEFNEYLAGEEVVIISDNYYTAAQVEFAGLSETTYNLDRYKAVVDGRALQYQIWQEDETALGGEAGKVALFITEDSTLTIPEKSEILGRACSYLENLEFIEQLWLFGQDKRFSFYRADSVRSEPSETLTNCPFPSRGWLDFPQEDEVLQGETRFSGWAFNEGIGLNEVHLLMDGERVSQLDYGNPRPDVVEAVGVESDPNRPDLGFDSILDTRAFENGEVELSLEFVNNAGERQIFDSRRVTIANP